MQEPTTKLDWLAERALAAFRSDPDNSSSWINDKEREFHVMDRLKVLRSFTNLDHCNLDAVAMEIGVTVEEMQATMNVLRKI